MSDKLQFVVNALNSQLERNNRIDKLKFVGQCSADLAACRAPVRKGLCLFGQCLVICGEASSRLRSGASLLFISTPDGKASLTALGSGKPLAVEPAPGSYDRDCKAYIDTAGNTRWQSSEDSKR